MTALLRFPNTHAVYVCHGWYNSIGTPPRFPRVLSCVAVDSQCRGKLVFEHGVTEERVSVLWQFVGLKKFRTPSGPGGRAERARLSSSARSYSRGRAGEKFSIDKGAVSFKSFSSLRASAFQPHSSPCSFVRTRATGSARVSN